MATYWVTQAASGGGDGSSGSPYTLAEAADNVVAGDKVWVKADADYTTEDGTNDCILHISVVGSTTAPIVWEGYHTSSGDGGIATLDATSTHGNAIGTSLSSTGAYNVFKSMSFENSTGVGVDFGATVDHVGLKNCQIANCGSHGLECDDALYAINCMFTGNGGASGHYGIFPDGASLLHSCVFHSNYDGGFRADASASVLIDCLIYGNNTGAGTTAAIFDNGITLIGCTIDAEGGAASIAVSSGSGSALHHLINNVFYDYQDGIVVGSTLGERSMIRNNLYRMRTGGTGIDIDTRLLPMSTGNGVGNRGDVDSTQGDTALFTAAGSDDYRIPNSSSDAYQAGIDAKFCVDFWASFNEATNPPSP